MGEKLEIISKAYLSLYQLLEIKQRFTDQIMTGKNPARSVDDIDGAALNYAEIKALSSGDDRIREKVTLEMEISRLEVLKNRHSSELFHMEHQQKVLPAEIKGLKERIFFMEKDQEAVHSKLSRTSEGKLIPAIVKGMTFETQDQAGKALVESVKRLSVRDTWVTIGTLRGFEIQGMAVDKGNRGEIGIKLALKGKCRYPIDLHESGTTIMLRLNNVLDYDIDNRLDKNRKHLAACESDLANIQNEINKPFPDEALLQEKKARLAKLDEELNLEAQEKQSSAHADAMTDVEVVPEEESSVKRPLSEQIANASARAVSSGSMDSHPERSSFYARS